MPTGLNEDGKLVIDFADAQPLWDSLTDKQKYDMTNMMFEPVLANATTMHKALKEIILLAELIDCQAIIKAAEAALPK